MRVPTVLLVAVSVWSAVSASADPIASSTFNTGSEGWLLVSTIGYSGSVTWTNSGGNPGGFIYGQDPDAGAFGFSAPSKFLGNVSGAYNQPFSFDVAAYTQPDAGAVGWVGISGPVGDFVCDYAVPTLPHPTWYSRSILLHESAGWTNASNGQPITHDQMVQTLADMDGLVIAAEFVRVG